MTTGSPASDALRAAIAKAVGKALYGWGDDEPNTATGFLVRHDVKAVTDAVLEALRAAPAAEPQGLAVELPQPWVFDGIRRHYENAVPLDEWEARATDPRQLVWKQGMPKVVGIGPTPEQAIRDLLTRLSQQPEATR